MGGWRRRRGGGGPQAKCLNGSHKYANIRSIDFPTTFLYSLSHPSKYSRATMILHYYIYSVYFVYSVICLLNGKYLHIIDSHTLEREYS